MRLPHRRLRVPILVLATPLLMVATGCSAGSGGGTAHAVTVTATDTECRVSDTQLQAGAAKFAVTNKGSKVTEVYVYAEESGQFTQTIGEVENIGPGTSRDLRVDLQVGNYQVACKPGQTGSGIRTDISVK